MGVSADTNGHEANGSWSPALSEHAKNLVRNPIRRIVTKMQQNPKCLMLAGGRPPADVFPPGPATDLGQELMNYGPGLATGTPELKDWAKNFVEKYHSPPGGWEKRVTHITSGNTDGMTKSVLLLTNPGDVILADNFTYPGITASARPYGRNVVGVKMDEQGMIPEELEIEFLKTVHGQGKARMIYVCPHGQNPTGSSFSLERKRAIYAIAKRYDLIIVEDDPYFFLHLAPYAQSNGKSLEAKSMLGTEGFPRSFLSIDTDGRVVRLDSVSKILAPGFRIGWATMHEAVSQKWHVLSEVTTWSVSGLQQHTLLKTVTDWGDQGLHEHLQKLQSTYTQRRDFLIKACQKHLQGLCRWNVPDFGMFLWLEVLGVADTASIIEELIEVYDIAMVPGGGFNASGDEGVPCAFFRVSFSLLNEEKADQAMERLRRALVTRANTVAGGKTNGGYASA